MSKSLIYSLPASFTTISDGIKHASVFISVFSAMSFFACVANISPVETSVKQTPKKSFSKYTQARKLFELSFSITSTDAVPGVTTLITSRLTRPFAKAGSSVCSHIATLYPFAMSFAMYPCALWKGTPHMGARSFKPQFFPVSVSSSSLDAVRASSKNIS